MRKPTITIEMRDVTKMEIECTVENCPNLDYMLAMIDQARRSLQVQYEVGLHNQMMAAAEQKAEADEKPRIVKPQ